MDVLQRHVDVADHFLALSDAGDQLIAPMRRMSVEQADPELTLDFV
jgi:hypothetical protein